MDQLDLAEDKKKLIMSENATQLFKIDLEKVTLLKDKSNANSR